MSVSYPQSFWISCSWAFHLLLCFQSHLPQFGFTLKNERKHSDGEKYSLSCMSLTVINTETCTVGGFVKEELLSVPCYSTPRLAKRKECWLANQNQAKIQKRINILQVKFATALWNYGETKICSNACFLSLSKAACHFFYVAYWAFYVAYWTFIYII